MNEIKEALSKATPGTWEIKQDKFFANTKGISSNGYYIGGGFNEGDVHLIANAPEWLASLVSKVEEMQKALEWYADKNNHDWTVDFCDHLTLSNAMKDEGERARQALKGETNEPR